VYVCSNITKTVATDVVNYKKKEQQFFLNIYHEFNVMNNYIITTYRLKKFESKLEESKPAESEW